MAALCSSAVGAPPPPPRRFPLVVCAGSFICRLLHRVRLMLRDTVVARGWSAPSVRTSTRLARSMNPIACPVLPSRSRQQPRLLYAAAVSGCCSPSAAPVCVSRAARRRGVDVLTFFLVISSR